MKQVNYICVVAIACALFSADRAFAQASGEAAKLAPRQTAAARDGQHDFDFEIGTWKTHLRRRLHPLTGSTT